MSTLSPQDMLTPRVLLKRAFGEGPPSDGDNSAQLGTNCGSSEIQLESLVSVYIAPSGSCTVARHVMREHLDVSRPTVGEVQTSQHDCVDYCVHMCNGQ